jgi:hypothetical protein
VEEPDEEEPEEDPEEPTAPKLLVTIQVFDDGTTKQTKNA